MRLNSDQVQAIKTTAQHLLGDDVRVTLFGSRANDELRGGDVDLLFETPHSLSDRVGITGKLYARLIRHLGDRKIDVVLKDAMTPEAPVMQAARNNGVVL
jgi:predicted nucleotidyltransferase